MMYWGGWNGGWMIGGMILMIIFWGAVIWLVVWGIRKATNHGSSSAVTGGRTPLEIAKERYAKGEITLQQFEEIKRNL
jgi:putative membrane protein